MSAGAHFEPCGDTISLRSEVTSSIKILSLRRVEDERRELVRVPTRKDAAGDKAEKRQVFQNIETCVFICMDVREGVPERERKRGRERASDRERESSRERQARETARVPPGPGACEFRHLPAPESSDP